MPKFKPERKLQKTCIKLFESYKFSLWKQEYFVKLGQGRQGQGDLIFISDTNLNGKKERLYAVCETKYINPNASSNTNKNKIKIVEGQTRIYTALCIDQLKNENKELASFETCRVVACYFTNQMSNAREVKLQSVHVIKNNTTDIPHKLPKIFAELEPEPEPKPDPEAEPEPEPESEHQNLGT